jgi:1-acyl-sn-glycerol-3-phosphate acyltransferase
MKSDFQPPRDNRFIIRAMQFLDPLVARLWRKTVAIVAPAEDLARLRALRNERFLLCSNHPTLGDPLIIFELARRVGVTFNYMAARDVFWFPLGWLFQRIGTYSVLRGASDREAIRTTRRLLAQEDRKVVVFPEGVTHEHNDLLLPFHTGVIQMGFWALEDLEKLGKQVRLPVAPMAIKYVYVKDARPAIIARMAAVERGLGIEPSPKADLYARLRAVGERVLERMEHEFHLCPAPDAVLAERITAAKEQILERTARTLDVRLPAGAPLADRLHLLDNALVAYLAEYAESPIEYDRRLHQRRIEVAAPLRTDLRRFHNFLAVSDGYAAAQMTAERFLDVLGRLEVEVLGRPGPRVPNRAEVRVGEPLELEAYYPQYRQNKRAAVAEATAALQCRVEELLRPLSALGAPLAG